MARKYICVSVGPSKQTGEVQSACSPIVELQDGRKFLGKDRIYVDDILDIGDIVDITQSVSAV